MSSLNNDVEGGYLEQSLEALDTAKSFKHLANEGNERQKVKMRLYVSEDGARCGRGPRYLDKILSRYLSKVLED
jgi:hypothetical protein